MCLYFLFMSLAMDVLLSTASIMNLCLISLDRYWSITKAVEYLKTRTPARALVMIASVWIMSALICIPPLLGWGVKRSEESLPQCEVSYSNIFELKTKYICILSHIECDCLLTILGGIQSESEAIFCFVSQSFEQ